MEIHTTRFGPITVEESAIITFPAGILGFANQKRYVLLDVADYAPLKWLQSLEESWLAFVIVEPNEFLPEYDIQVESNGVSELGLSSPEDARVYVIVTVMETTQEATANLQAPIILNPAKRVAKQVILMDSDYSIRHPIFGNSK